jgi:NADH-quinone oxidoreductase subunit C
VNTKEVFAALQEDGLGADLVLSEAPKDAAIVVPAARLKEVARHLRDSRRLAFDLLVMVTGTHVTEKKDAKGVVTREPCFELVYHVRSIRHGGLLVFKVRLPLEEPTVDTVSDLWPAANWHERETFDLVGIRFTGHPDLRRILLPDDWEGHPLRKDYVYPRAYRDINLEVDAPWPTP